MLKGTIKGIKSNAINKKLALIKPISILIPTVQNKNPSNIKILIITFQHGLINENEEINLKSIRALCSTVNKVWC